MSVGWPILAYISAALYSVAYTIYYSVHSCTARWLGAHTHGENKHSSCLWPLSPHPSLPSLYNSYHPVVIIGHPPSSPPFIFTPRCHFSSDRSEFYLRTNTSREWTKLTKSCLINLRVLPKKINGGMWLKLYSWATGVS